EVYIRCRAVGKAGLSGGCGRQRHGGPIGGGGGNELIGAMRKIAFEVRHDGYNSALDVPRSIFELRGQQKSYSPLVRVVVRTERAAFLQGEQRLACRISIVRKRRDLGP